MMHIAYEVAMPNPATHVYQFTLHIKGVTEEFVHLELPVWTPGSYLVREYAKNVNALQATDAQGDILPVVKTQKNSWAVYAAGNDFTVTYEIYAFEESVRTCWLDSSHASLIPAACFLWVAGYEGGVEITIHPHESFKKIATALPNAQNNVWQLIAADKVTLYDSPIEIGNHETYTFEAAGIPHTLAIYGEGNHNAQQIIADLIKIIDTEVKIFQSHPCDKYLFILLNSHTQRGGLEHLFSTSLIFKRFGYTARTSYLEFISLCAHEYFHLWNVKRLRPAALGPFNYGEENYTTGLWVAEGFTSYFDDLIVYRAGIYTENEYLNVVEKNINDAENAPGKHVQSVAEASFDAWIKYYRQNENSNNSQVNYYVRGGVLALLLDLMIIRHSKGLYNINDVIRDAYNQFYLQRNQGFTEAELKAIIEQYAGENLDWFYDNHVFGTKQIDYSIFAAFGLQLVNQNEGKLELDLGIVINDKNAIQSVRKNSAGEKGGLNVNDEIIAINNFRYATGLLTQFTENKSAGDTLQLTISRSGMLQTFDVTLQNTDKVDYKLTPLENSGAAQKSLYEIWLKR